MILARKALFYLFFLIYLILCPLIILSSFGYILNPEKNRISQTGLLRISTAPSQASIFLQHRRYKYRTPATIDELIPGNYTLTIRLRGYRPWEHSVCVTEGKAAVFENIILIPSVLEQKRISRESFTELIPLSGSGYFLLQSGPKLGDVFTFNLDTEDLNKLVFSDSQEADLPVISFFTEKDSRLLVIYCGSLWEKRYLLKKFADKERTLIDITKLVTARPNLFIWSPQNEKSLFLIYQDYANRIDIDSMAVFPRYLENIRGFGIIGENLYVLDKNNFVERIDYDKTDSRMFRPKGFSNRDLLARSNFYQIRRFLDDALLFWGDKGQLVVTSVPFALASKDVRGMAYNEQKKVLLFWSRKYIRMTDYDNTDSEEEQGYGNPVNLNTLYEHGTDIEQCFWGDANHFICRDADTVFLIELEQDGRHHKEELFQVKDNSDVFYSGDNGRLYYLDKKSGNLMSSEIIPKKNFIFTTFMQEDQKEDNQNGF